MALLSQGVYRALKTPKTLKWESRTPKTLKLAEYFHKTPKTPKTDDALTKILLLPF